MWQAQTPHLLSASGLLTLASALPETVLVLVAAGVAWNAGRGGLLAGMVAAAVEGLRQVPGLLQLGLLARPSGGHVDLALAVIVLVVLTNAAGLGLFAFARPRTPGPAHPAAHGRGVRRARTALVVEAGLCGIAAAAGAWLLWSGFRGWAPWIGGRDLMEAGLTMAPLVLCAVYLLQRPTQAAIGLVMAIQAAWALVGLLTIGVLTSAAGIFAIGLALTFIPPLAVFGLLLWVRPAPADNLSR